MSLFGSLMGDFDDDPVFGTHMQSMRHLNTMMNSFFNNPFGMMGQNALTEGPHGARGHQPEHPMMPFGFPPMPHFNMSRVFANFDNMAANANSHSYMSKSVMTLATGPDGRPQVYKETMSTTTAPGGVKETKKTVCDSRTGTKKMAIGHHIGDRAHILEREQNLHNGEQEERQEFINLDEDEAESFNHEWQSRTRRPVGAIRGVDYGPQSGHRSRPDHKQLALPAPSSSSNSSNPTGQTKSASVKPPAATTTSTPAETSTSTSAATSTSTSKTTAGNRKREHTPDTKVCKKRPAVSDSDV